MGGSSFDDYKSVAKDHSSSSSGMSYSAAAEEKFQQVKSVKKSFLVKNREIVSETDNTVIACLDDTGSMGDAAKVILGKVKMFSGQIIRNQYLDNYSIGFCAVGDADCDQVALQATNLFKPRAKKSDKDYLEEALGHIWLEGGGGGDHRESYELAAYYYAKHCKVNPNGKNYFFFICDENFKTQLDKEYIKDIVGDTVKQPMSPHEIFSELKEKFEVFLIHVTYWQAAHDRIIVKDWKKELGDHRVIELPDNDKESVVDLMLGTIAVTSGKRTLDEYCKDMENREQSKNRVSNVKKALSNLSGYIDKTPAKDSDIKAHVSKSLSVEEKIIEMEPI